MAFQNVLISQPARLSLDKSRLRIDRDSGTLHLPLEDIATLTLESPEILLTQPLLAACAAQGVAVVICNEQHHPSGLSLPFAPHSRQGEVAQAQRGWSTAFRGAVWRQWITAKIQNQHNALATAIGPLERLTKLADTVNARNASQQEAQAARIYFPRLFGDDFRRHGADSINAALDYGYSVIRAAVARSLVAYGFLPPWGIHHKHPQNAFNLADDLLEPFRPWVDYWVWLDPDRDADLSIARRARLIEVLQIACAIDGRTYGLQTAIDRAAQSLVAATSNNSARNLALPTWPGRFERVGLPDA